MDNISKSRERAEAAFGKVQSEFTSRSRVLDEHDASFRRAMKRPLVYANCDWQKKPARLQSSSLPSASAPPSKRIGGVHQSARRLLPASAAGICLRAEPPFSISMVDDGRVIILLATHVKYVLSRVDRNIAFDVA